MNNIIINKQNYHDGTISLQNQELSTIEVDGNAIINLFNASINDLIILINDNSALTINSYNVINKQNTNITINVKNNSSFTLNHSFITKNEYNLNISSNFLKENSNITINIHNINDSGTSNINIDGFIKSQKINNTLMENIRVYNINNGKCSSMPKMFIDTSKVIANHNVTISDIKDDDLFYLESKGISKEKAITLLCNGFLIAIINDEDLKIKIKESLIRR